ncbi:hypothetical protein RRG08_042577 [Elysia crispata]|uniref:Uncharacterized protein n=1 Tax=Elysia crispata TaxID=231223 RepID=A0AAE0XQ18_9GAST|nr:hypothetical protein RRG08_042577 [Elysia crispata]
MTSGYETQFYRVPIALYRQRKDSLPSAINLRVDILFTLLVDVHFLKSDTSYCNMLRESQFHCFLVEGAEYCPNIAQLSRRDSYSYFSWGYLHRKPEGPGAIDTEYIGLEAPSD